MEGHEGPTFLDASTLRRALRHEVSPLGISLRETIDAAMPLKAVGDTFNDRVPKRGHIDNAEGNSVGALGK